MKKTWAAILIFVLLYPLSLFGDGKMWKGKDASQLRSSSPNSQMGAIYHKDGRQRLVIRLNFDVDKADQALWIFPIPGNPQKTNLDLISRFPRFYGDDPMELPREICNVNAQMAFATQIYPTPIIIGLGGSILGARSGASRRYQSLDKWGIRSELIQVKSLLALQKYLQKKGQAKLNKEELQAFSPYFNSSFSLVVTWISSVEKVLKKFPKLKQHNYRFRRRSPSLFVEFDTKKPYYPMKATGSYGSERIPITLYALGYYKISGDQSKKIWEAKYYEQSSSSSRDKKFFQGHSSRQKGSDSFVYTRLRTKSVAAKNYTEDLYLEKKKWPLQLKVAMGLHNFRSRAISNRQSWTSTFVIDYLPFFVIFLYILFLSYITGGIAGRITYGKWMGRMGIWNCLTFFGLALAFRHRLKKEEKKDRGVLSNLLQKGGSHRFQSRWWLGLLFLVIAILFSLGYYSIFENDIRWFFRGTPDLKEIATAAGIVLGYLVGLGLLAVQFLYFLPYKFLFYFTLVLCLLNSAMLGLGYLFFRL